MAKKSSYEELRDEWYKKLRDIGFIDIEIYQHNSIRRRSSGGQKYGKLSREWQESKIAYYNMATRFLHEHKFTSSLEYSIWEYHTNGISTRNIADTLNKAKIVRTNRTKVWEIVRDLRTIMKSRYIK